MIDLFGIVDFASDLIINDMINDGKRESILDNDPAELKRLSELPTSRWYAEKSEKIWYLMDKQRRSYDNHYLGRIMRDKTCDDMSILSW
ncbi:hypothetical protein, partial [Rickettsia endosymbiont of Cardiosporidium cionae]|uniref:hypothetical protein n=1 Tax=Rickettsia endosymbiont of Cardiosporidium cionae TaxID=2777155 RepID=UPI0018937235